MSWSRKVVVDIQGPDQDVFAEHIMNHIRTTSGAFNVDAEQDWHDHDLNDDCSDCYEIHDNSRRS